MYIFQCELIFFLRERPEDTKYNVSKYIVLYTK